MRTTRYLLLTDEKKQVGLLKLVIQNLNIMFQLIINQKYNGWTDTTLHKQ